MNRARRVYGNNFQWGTQWAKMANERHEPFPCNGFADAAFGRWQSRLNIHDSERRKLKGGGKRTKLPLRFIGGVRKFLRGEYRRLKVHYCITTRGGVLSLDTKTRRHHGNGFSAFLSSGGESDSLSLSPFFPLLLLLPLSLSRGFTFKIFNGTALKFENKRRFESANDINAAV